MRRRIPTTLRGRRPRSPSTSNRCANIPNGAIPTRIREPRSASVFGKAPGQGSPHCTEVTPWYPHVSMGRCPPRESTTKALRFAVLKPRWGLRFALDVLDRANGAAEKHAPAEQKLRSLSLRYEKGMKRKKKQPACSVRKCTHIHSLYKGRPPAGRGTGSLSPGCGVPADRRMPASRGSARGGRL